MCKSITKHISTNLTLSILSSNPNIISFSGLLPHPICLPFRPSAPTSS